MTVQPRSPSQPLDQLMLVKDLQNQLMLFGSQLTAQQSDQKALQQLALEVRAISQEWQPLTHGKNLVAVLLATSDLLYSMLCQCLKQAAERKSEAAKDPESAGEKAPRPSKGKGTEPSGGTDVTPIRPEAADPST